MGLIYCTKCVIPNTRPGLTFNEMGVCSACESAEEKKKIDWVARENELRSIFDRFRSKDKTKYDCIIPVSGGKDSTYQVHIAKNVYKMNPLCVTFRTDARTNLGEKNLQSLREMGVDHIDFTPNPIGFCKLRKKCFLEEGDCSIPDHLAIWAIPPKIAIAFNIPLVVWGENPDIEYGGTTELRKVSMLTREWIESQNILKGKKTEDWVDGNLFLSEIKSLIYPSEEELSKINYTPIFLGYYTLWDAKKNVEIAKNYGFQVRKKGPMPGLLYDYADLDCMYLIIHHYFKYIKFGFGNISDHASNEIRKGRMTREEAIKLVREKDAFVPPKEYINHFCKHVGITKKKFWEIVDKFRGKDVWKKDENGEWFIDGWIGNKN